MRYTNPIIPGFHPDPSCCRVGEDYYLVTSSFEYFPGVPLFHSRDLVNWTPLGHVLTRPSQLPLDRCGPSGGVYAPTIRHHQGRFYMITTNVSGQGNFLVWTDDIRGQWSDPVAVESPGIDPSLFFDSDGRVYYTGNNGPDEAQGIYGFEIRVSDGRRIGPRVRLWGGTGGAYPEGPHLYRRGPWYYLIISEGGTEHGHMITAARSTSPLGPFEACPRNPILTNRSRLTRVKAVGHADFFEAPDGRWWAVCLAIRPQGYPEVHWLGRETFLVPVEWDEDGWPRAGTQGMADLEVEVPGPGPVQVRPTLGRESFRGPDFGPDWVFLRSRSSGVAQDPAGGLVLIGTAVGLDEADAPAFVGRRLEHLNLTLAAEVDFDPAQDGDEAGLVLWMNHRHHYEAAVTREGGQIFLVFRRRIGSLQAVEARVPWAGGPVIFAVKGTPEAFTFTYGRPGAAAQPLGAGEPRYLSTEVGGAFTGALAGLYAAGRGRPCASAARFPWFDYLPEGQ